MEQLKSQLRHIFSSPMAPGLVLFACAALALLFANSPLAPQYLKMVNLPINLNFFNIPGLHLNYPIYYWINDGMMAIFFYIIGLEVKYEVMQGSLSNPRKAALPICASFGGAIVPALIFFAINFNSPTTMNGWAIPLATDIAFALGVFAIFSRHLNPAIKLFLLLLAVVDDLIAILIIALFYTASLNFAYLLLAIFTCVIVFVLNRQRIWAAPLRTLCYLTIWYGTLKCGIHPTIAGVVIGLLTPVNGFKEERTSLHSRVQIWTPYSNFFILPLFALANAGLKLDFGSIFSGTNNLLFFGITLGLIIGKPLGVLGFSFLCEKLKLAQRGDLSWHDLLLVGTLASIGFTMALFISGLSFPKGSENFATAKSAILIGTLIALIINGGVILGGSRYAKKG